MASGRQTRWNTLTLITLTTKNCEPKADSIRRVCKLSQLS